MVLLIVVALGYGLRSSKVEGVQETAQSILDREIKDNALAVDAVNAP